MGVFKLGLGLGLYEEVNVRLSDAIMNKNFSEAAIAQGLLEVAKKKMDNVLEQSTKCSSKRTELDKNKKRLLEDYSKQVSQKKKNLLNKLRLGL